MNDRFWTRFLGFAGVFNILVGLVGTLAPDALAGPLGVAMPADSWLFHRIAGSAVFTFGIGYLMASANLDRHRGMIVIGVVGKSLAVALFALYWLHGTIPLRAFTLAIPDIVFVIFFLRFLRRYQAR